ncbi:2-oxoglutarate/Fe(II)-dependent oxygenase [Chloropicon primus]|uniref:2-oxoglutarate/Fe(II)-dependent oxygenase n=2 Tax=Chloropicon primus TaxID=1764295 RepID=A0A5B8N035_9CHLO|nr:2-oxoglutarate/Fe(II)-dependent oxygenase [Chloropicon primus]UPR04538.1 2-oxoglutarate/Fe(II)-dependent oxygenase [Chloropicon primus]|eukprot:QDZ25332.1 2-oxoglutarate/Fe(II)-dependent oxygenase [Chloropicon primus]
MFPTVKAQVIEVGDLEALCCEDASGEQAERNAKTLEKIRESLGRDGLGIIAVRGVEGLAEAREALLPLADTLADLPKQQLGDLEDEASSYSIGWSHGKETLEGGVPDTFKGSFYANPIHDAHEVTEEELEKYPSYTRPNVWPHDSIPELKPALMNMGALIVKHGKLLATACDELTRKELGLAKDADLGLSSIEGAIGDSFACKARLLHYFPPSEVKTETSDEKMGDWCGWHLDHGSLTGLTSAMFTDCKGNQVDNPDPQKCGLYVKSRKGETVRVTYTKDCIAYQVGESSEVMSNGVLKATPHCVVGAEGEAALGVARNTFAVFMQPKWDLVLEAAEDKSGTGEVETKGFTPGINFGEFTDIKLNEYYS